jgi:hypothetical protein
MDEVSEPCPQAVSFISLAPNEPILPHYGTRMTNLAEVCARSHVVVSRLKLVEAEPSC